VSITFKNTLFAFWNKNKFLEDYDLFQIVLMVLSIYSYITESFQEKLDHFDNIPFTEVSVIGQNNMATEKALFKFTTTKLQLIMFSLKVFQLQS
jgi:hypothetical protein